MSKKTRSKWVNGLLGALIGGFAGALDSGFALVLIAPDKFNMDAGLAKLLTGMGVFAVLSGIKVAAAYLKQTPLPEPDPETTT